MDTFSLHEELKRVYGTDEYRAILRLLKEENRSEDADVLRRLVAGEPLQYVLGYAWFYNRKFHVNKNTLIPRPETEELVHYILQEFKNRRITGCDIGTGSGCIPITLVAEHTDAQMVATDISAEALEVAKSNANETDTASRIEFIRQNFLTEPFAGSHFNLIVSNPPYIHIREKAEMAAHVKEWEPHMALFPEGDDALIFYRRLAEFLRAQTDPECVLWAEINPVFTEDLQAIYSNDLHLEIRKDISGNARFIRAQKKGR